MYNVSVIISINALMCKHHFYTVLSDDAYVVCEISKCDASQETMVVMVLQTPKYFTYVVFTDLSSVLITHNCNSYKTNE